MHNLLSSDGLFGSSPKLSVMVFLAWLLELSQQFFDIKGEILFVIHPSNRLFVRVNEDDEIQNSIEAALKLAEVSGCYFSLLDVAAVWFCGCSFNLHWDGSNEGVFVELSTAVNVNASVNADSAIIDFDMWEDVIYASESRAHGVNCYFFDLFVIEFCHVALLPPKFSLNAP